MLKRVPRVLVLVALVALVAGCSAGASQAPGTLSAAPGASSAGMREIAVSMTDALRYEPGAFEVMSGERVRFVVTNHGKIRHEFFVGNEDAQHEHEAEMRSMGMAHDEPDGISVDPGQTKSMEFTFSDPADTMVGCHEPGHYEGGMKATITVGS